MEMSFEIILSALKKKEYKPVYFLCGEESYYIDIISDYIQDNVLNESEKTFNQTVLYGKDTDALTVMNSAKRFPMMSSHQVVIVKEAQELKEFEKLVHYIEQPLSSTILVLNYKYKKPDKRKKVFKSLIQQSAYMETKKLYDNQLPEWISSYVSKKGYSIDNKAAALLAEFLGSDLSKISNEVDKLIIILDDKEKNITADHIERNIGISKDYNNFELQKALAVKDVLKANRIINYFADNPKNHPIVLTITSLYSFFSKVLIYYWIKDKSLDNVAREMGLRSTFIARDYITAAKNYNANKLIAIISILRDYDLKSKGFGGANIEDGDLMKEMIFKILH